MNLILQSTIEIYWILSFIDLPTTVFEHVSIDKKSTLQSKL